MPAASKEIYVVLISGWLGSGKTTLLGNLLSSDILAGKRVAVLVNEFGHLPVDGALLPEGDYYLTEIDKGSIFCICVKTDLMHDLEHIAREVKPDILLVEATGVAEPTDLTALLQSEFLRERYRQAQIMTIVDALNFPKLVQILPALTAQVKLADLLLLNKIDLVDESALLKLEEFLGKLNSRATIIRTDHAALQLGLDQILTGSRGRSGDSGDLTLCAAAPAETGTCEFRSRKQINRRSFYRVLELYRNDILRGKGVVDFGDGRIFVELVNGAISSRPASGMKFAPDQRAAMCFILRGADMEEFQMALQGTIIQNQSV